MAISSQGVRTTNVTSSQAAWELRTGSASKPKILEVDLIQTATTASSYGFGRPAAAGITPVNTLFQMDDPGDPASICNVSLSWGTSPTAPNIYMRRWNSNNVIGVGVIWTFPRGLAVPISSSMVIFNITTTVACDVNCILDE